MCDQEKIEEIDRYIIECSISLLGFETTLVQPYFFSQITFKISRKDQDLRTDYIIKLTPRH